MSFFFTSDCVLDGDVDCLLVGGEIDYEATPQLRQQIAAAINTGKPVVLDLSPATFIDSTGIGVLVGASKELSEAGNGPLAVVCTNAQVLRIFDLTGLDRAVALHETREQALSMLA